MNIGAGRVVMQDLPQSMRPWKTARLPSIRMAALGAMKDRRRVHVMGLLSSGGVHSHKNQTAVINGLTPPGRDHPSSFHRRT